MDMTPPVGGCESKEHGQDHESAFEAGTQLADSARTILPEVLFPSLTMVLTHDSADRSGLRKETGACTRHRHRLPYPREIQTSDDKHVPYRWGKKLHDCEEMEDASDDYMEEMRSPHAFKGMETRCEGLGLLESLQQLAPHLTPDPPRKWPPSLLIERRLWDSATPEDQGQALQQLRQLGLTSAVLDPA
ncbi:hypothetical protein WJX73_008991 [Symbiochloris irregularis]|uniref:Uncharacterized protein n=1 Tax=Symbiochloris irregularis TaxID=706552 RepID=A0AAW1PBR3_9CHLO